MKDIMGILDIILRSLISVLFLFFMTKLMGRKQMSQLNMFDYIIGISIGSIAAAMAVDRDTKYLYGIAAILIYSLADMFISYITIQSIAIRRFVDGTPIVLIKNGELIKSGLKAAKYDVNSLLQECRSQGYFDIADIQYAISESNGKVSVMPKWNKKPVMTEDMAIPSQEQQLTANIIIDGKIMPRNLKHIGKDEQWLKKELEKQKVDKISDVFFATADINGNLKVYLNKNDTKKTILE
ncbi:MAG: DUF421 domain-containing protein [Bacillota bacterium]|nr:DUF421 domain-containing protein [Bacillota bacterium]